MIAPEAPAPLVSVIVPTKNSARTVRAALDSIRRQTHDALELIVVDNGSSDGTADEARAVADAVLDVGPERSAQRNAGAAVARGAYLLFIDSDMVLDPNVVSECVLAAQAADAVVIPEVSFGEGFWARCKALERSCYVGDEAIEAARFFAREAFLGCGGYDEGLLGAEDWDIHERVRAHGARIARVEALIRHDEGRLRLRRLVAKKFYYGRDIAKYLRKHPRLGRQQVRLIRPAFIRHRRRLVAEPALLAGVTLMKLCEVGSAALGLLVGGRFTSVPAGQRGSRRPSGARRGRSGRGRADGAAHGSATSLPRASTPRT